MTLTDKKTFELALEALRNSEPIMKHYPEPVARHDAAIAAVQHVLQLAGMGRSKKAKVQRPRIRCNQCEACMINGVFCHETSRK